MGIPRVFVFSWNTGEGEGIVNLDYSPRWCTVEYRTMADQLSGAASSASSSSPTTSAATSSPAAARMARRCWPPGPTWPSSAPVRLSATGPLSVTDIMGNTQTVQPQDGVATVTLSYQPVFIGGLAADVQVKSRRSRTALHAAWERTPPR